MNIHHSNRLPNQSSKHNTTTTPFQSLRKKKSILFFFLQFFGRQKTTLKHRVIKLARHKPSLTATITHEQPSGRRLLASSAALSEVITPALFLKHIKNNVGPLCARSLSKKRLPVQDDFCDPLPLYDFSIFQKNTSTKETEQRINIFQSVSPGTNVFPIHKLSTKYNKQITQIEFWQVQPHHTLEVNLNEWKI